MIDCMSTAPEPHGLRPNRMTRWVKRQWRRIRQVGAILPRLLRPKHRTVSERLFERYLRDRGQRWTYEKRFAGTLKRPDYTVVIGGQETVFDVKEFEATPDDVLTGVGAFDPYEAVRAKIHGVREQFKDLKHLPCCLVLFNANKPLVDLRPMFVLGAMLGNAGITFPEEILQEHEAAESTDRDPALLRLGIAVIENPYATKRLSAEFGRGPWDEGYGPENGALGQLYVGAELLKLRDDELAVGIKGPTLL